jgi:NAD+ kinase
VSRARTPESVVAQRGKAIREPAREGARRPLRSIGVTANLEKENARPLVRELVAALAARGLDVYLDDEFANLTGDFPPARQGVPANCDALVAVGGDGTLLKVARRYAGREIPIVGVKGGRLGFLAEAGAERVASLLTENTFVVQERMRIRGVVTRSRGVVASFTALNDLVVHSTGYSRMVGLRVEVGGKLLREFSADGLIVATPTGSTAYSLSAGGPVVEPTLAAIVVTPLNPHTVSMRPMVVGAEQTVSVHVTSAPSGVMITVDGQEGIEFDPTQSLEVSRDEHPTHLLVSRDYDFFSLLREKL